MVKKNFKDNIAKIKRSRRFIRYGESFGFARGLESLLYEIRDKVNDPHTGVELVLDFYKADNGALGNCDDSSGSVGDVFRHTAKELFVYYASRNEDKEWLIDQVIKLNKKDDYGVRDSLFYCAAEYLSEEVMRSAIERFWKLADSEPDELGKWHWFGAIKSFAKQLKDALLFERAYKAIYGKRGMHDGGYIDIAAVYLDSGDAKRALDLLTKVPLNESHLADKRDDLLLKVYMDLSDKENATLAAWRIFRRCRSTQTFSKPLDVIGEDQREQIIAKEVEMIFAGNKFSESDADFLVDLGDLATAESYILYHADQLNGHNYGFMLDMAKTMEKNNRLLPASVMYRALTDTTMSKAQSKYYHYAVRYIRILDKMASNITDWRGVPSHEEYMAEFRNKHKLKSSFWKKYEG